MSLLQVLIPFAAYGFIVLVAFGLCRAADKPEPRPEEVEQR